MICEKYAALSIKEKIEYVGKLLHGVQSLNAMFDEGAKIINVAESIGLYEDVKFGSDVELTIKKEVD
jgi:hypothetical protein